MEGGSSTEETAAAETGRETTAVQAHEREPLIPGAVMERKLMKVMVAIDESEGSFYALRWAITHLEKCIGVDAVSAIPEAVYPEDAGIILLVHVQQPFQQFIYPADPTGAAFYATSSMVETVRKAQEENSSIILSRALQMCREKTIKAETLILNGDPKEMICQATEQMDIDLLLVGSRGLGTIKSILGSVSDYCAHHAKCPVLIVKPPKEGSSK